MLKTLVAGIAGGMAMKDEFLCSTGVCLLRTQTTMP